MKYLIILSSIAFLSLSSFAYASVTVHGDYRGWACEAMDAGNNCQD